MSIEMFSERQLKFVRQPRIGRLGSTMKDGAPHVSPIWYRFEDESGHFLALVERGGQKHKNVQRDPRVVLCIDDERPPYHTVLVRGRVQIDPAPGVEWRLALAVHYLGEESGRRYIESRDDPNNIMLRVVPERVTGW